MRQQIRFAMLVLLLMMPLAAISTAQEDRLQVVGSHSILTDVIMNVAGDAADVTSVMHLGADPHSFQPTPSDLTALADADVVFINGAFFEEGLLEAIENAGDDMNIMTVSSCVQIIAFGGHDHEGEEHDHEEGEEHDHEEGEEHEHEEGEEHMDDDHASDEASEGDMGDMSALAALCEQHVAEMAAMHESDEDHDHEEGEEHDHEHDHGACDPHVWMEPHNVMYWTMFIRDTLIELDPTNAETYTANAAAYLEEVDALVHDFVRPMVETLPEEDRVLITNHDAFGYFAASNEFEIVDTIIPSFSTLAQASAADVAEVIDLIGEQDVPAIFAETTVSDDLAQQIADETGVEVAVLYSGSLSEADGPASTYVDYITYNVTTIVEALGGGM